MTISDRLDIIVLWLRKNSSALGRCLVVFFYYVIGVIYYQRNEGWDVGDCIYFITGKKYILRSCDGLVLND
jgi:hypothetical protein